jgi:hypothetical protein
MCTIQNGWGKPFWWWSVKGCSIQSNDCNIWAQIVNTQQTICLPLHKFSRDL